MPPKKVRDYRSRYLAKLKQAIWLHKLAEADQRRASFQDMAAEGLITFDELRTKLAALEETRQLARRELDVLEDRRERL